MYYDVDSAVSRYRNAHAAPGAPIRPTEFVNPTEDESVRASAFLQHLNLDNREIRRALKTAYPSLRYTPTFYAEICARVRFVAWMTLQGFNVLSEAYRALASNPNVIIELGFTRNPTYEKLRHFINERLPGATKRRLTRALRREMKCLKRTLGRSQVQDATPLEALRRDNEAVYNGHYKCRMYKSDLRWDVEHEALLSWDFKAGTVAEGPSLAQHTTVLHEDGYSVESITIDGGYTSFQNIAQHWRMGIRLHFKRQQGWRVNAKSARDDVNKRYQNHWQHPAFIPNASHNAKLRFLIDHGTEHDVEAAARFIRDESIENQTADLRDTTSKHRSLNEALNAELKRLPLRPARRGEMEARRRLTACGLTLLLVQLTRLQNGVTTGLCRTAYII